MNSLLKILLTFAVSAFIAFGLIIGLTDLSGLELLKQVAMSTLVIHGSSTLNSYIVTGRWDFFKSSN